jgi:hypothetical protein
MSDSRRPDDTAVRQQRMKAWFPILHPVWVIITLFILSGIFIPIGFKLREISDSIVEYAIKYDSHEDGNWSNCELNGLDEVNSAKTCTLTFDILKDMEGPVLVYYEIENFHQNHRTYEQSRDDWQLLGASEQTQLQKDNCAPLNKLGNITLNPCGLIANTMFNDVIEFAPTDNQSAAKLDMIEDGIAWQSDLEYKFRQPDGFETEECDCDDCGCDDGSKWQCYNDEKTGKCHKYFYPNDDETQYLYETYPMVITPTEGVMNEHFVVWMRIASFPHFRKLYGYFDASVKAGQRLSFKVTANWDVKSFKGSKSLVLTTSSAFGGKNDQFPNCFIGLGIFFFLVAIFFMLKHTIKPRKLADDKYLKYKAA